MGSYSQISDTTAIPVADLKRALQSLACAKFKILRKDPVGRDVDDTDSFTFNEDFSAKQLRFKVGTVSAVKENEAEVTTQLTSRFLPHPNVIKKRIESLIERDFLERDKGNWRKYTYLA